MSHRELTAAVAAATGESSCTIRALGFGLADPALPDYDPEPYAGAGYLDWDEVQDQRHALWND
ncbi:MAG: hypothetical protein KDA44_10665 [Planctomycetales bacterium]|nr:hypothetical protein [Planctomycetales bacterium]